MQYCFKQIVFTKTQLATKEAFQIIKDFCVELISIVVNIKQSNEKAKKYKKIITVKTVLQG